MNEMDADLKIGLTMSGNYPTLNLEGEVDAYTCSSFREAMIEALESHGKDLIINMCDVEYIDSSGLGALVGGLKRVSEKQGRIFVVCSNPQVRKVFDITGLVKVFPVYETVDDAAKAMAAGHSAEAAVQ